MEDTSEYGEFILFAFIGLFEMDQRMFMLDSFKYEMTIIIIIIVIIIIILLLIIIKGINHEFRNFPIDSL